MLGFPGLSELRRRAVRATPNPMDKATIVSIYPRPVHEVKQTLFPGTFDIPSGSFDSPAVLIVGTSSWWKDVGEDQPMLEIPNSAIQVANSVVVDYCNGLLGCNMGDAMPGLFFLPGEFTSLDIKVKHKNLLEAAKVKQVNWYTALVQMGDILWARTNGNPLSISDDMRLAAQELNLQNKEWLKDFQTMELVRCVACGTLNNSRVIVCPNCKVVVKPEEFKKLNLQFAGA